MGIHIASRFLQALQPLGIESEDLRPVLEVSEAEADALIAYTRNNGLASYFFVNISSSRPAREWPAQKWVEFLHKIGTKSPGFLVCSAPKDKEKALFVADQVENAKFYPTKSIKDVSAAIAHCQLVLTVDTAIVHIAAAFNKPLLGLYINIYREYSKYFPLSETSRIIFVEEDNGTVDQIPVERVVEEFDELMKALGA